MHDFVMDPQNFSRIAARVPRFVWYFWVPSMDPQFFIISKKVILGTHLVLGSQGPQDPQQIPRFLSFFSYILARIIIK